MYVLPTHTSDAADMLRVISLSPPRHMTKLDGNPEDSGGVGAYSRLKRGDTASEQIYTVLYTVYLYIYTYNK